MDCILTFDVGTTAIKACLFDRELNQLCNVREEYSLETGDGFVELSPNLYWETIRSATSKALVLIPDSRVRAVIAATQGETLIPVDSAGVPLRKALVWLDSRASKEAAYLSDYFPGNTFRKVTGLPELTGACPIAKLLWIKNNQQDIFEQTKKFLLLEDWLLFRLTGLFCSEKTLLTSTGYFNLETDDYWYDILDAAGIPTNKLPEICDPGKFCGILTAETASELGLSEGVPVFSGAMDQTASAIGAGNLCEGIVTETTGTALAVAATICDSTAANQGVTVYRHALTGGRFLHLSISNTAGIVLKWFKDQFYSDLSEVHSSKRFCIYDALAEIAQTVPPLCNGLSLFPHFEGTTIPDTNTSVRGVFLGIGLDTTRAHFLRAVFEGVAFMLREDMEALNCPVMQVRSLGGASSSKVWSQIKSDVTGKQILTYEYESTSRGVAILAACGLGWYKDLSDFSDSLPPGNIYEPGSDKELYEKGYEQYLRMNKYFQPLFQGRI